MHNKQALHPPAGAGNEGVFFMCSLIKIDHLMSGRQVVFFSHMRKCRRVAMGVLPPLPYPYSQHVPSHYTACHTFTILPGLGLMKLQFYNFQLWDKSGEEMVYFLCVLTSTLLLHYQTHLCTLIKPHHH